MPTSFRIMPAREKDALEIFQLIGRSISEICSSAYDEEALGIWQARRTQKHIEDWISEDGGLFLIARSLSNQIVGAALFLAPNIIKLCYVLPDFVGQGIGTLLMNHLEKHARNSGATSIRLSSTFNATEFYFKLGYQHQGEETALGSIRYVKMMKTGL